MLVHFLRLEDIHNLIGTGVEYTVVVEGLASLDEQLLQVSDTFPLTSFSSIVTTQLRFSGMIISRALLHSFRLH